MLIRITLSIEFIDFTQTIRINEISIKAIPAAHYQIEGKDGMPDCVSFILSVYDKTLFFWGDGVIYSGLINRLSQVYSNNVSMNSSKWLDIGAGNGEFIQALKKHFSQLRVIDGIEPNFNKIKDAKNFGINLYYNLNELNNSYDYISLVNVFSHFSNPNSEILEIKDKLSPYGELLIVTGNGADISYNEYPEDLSLPDHLIFTGEAHLKDYLYNLGFITISFVR